VPVSQVEAVARDAGLPPDDAAAVADDYGQAQLDGLQKALLAIAFLGIGALWFTRRLPSRPLAQVLEGERAPPEEESVPAGGAPEPAGA
jgi:hypothetical protein